MNEITAFFQNQEVATPMVLFFMLFSCAIAFFHTFIFIGLYRLTLPHWFFFVLNPTLIGISFVINPHFSLFVFCVEFVSVFILAFIGMLYSAITKSKEEKLALTQLNLQFNTKKEPFWMKIPKALFIILVLFTGPVGFFILFIVLILYVLFPNSKNRFLKYQSVLATTKIATLKAGIAKIEGKVVMIEPLFSPILNKECVAYEYTIDEITTDSEGDTHYSHFFSDAKCNPFYIEDATGKIMVHSDKLNFLWLEQDTQNTKSSKRYSQNLIQADDEVSIIGKVRFENNSPILEYENNKKIFTISPKHKIDNYKTHKPLLDSFKIYIVVFAVLVFIILIQTENPLKNILEYHFKTTLFLEILENEPSYPFIWATFGMPLLMLICSFPLLLFKKTNGYEGLKKFYSALFIHFAFCWILSFLSQMMLLLFDVSGIKMFSIWIIMITTYLIFFILNQKGISKWIDSKEFKKK